MTISLASASGHFAPDSQLPQRHKTNHILRIILFSLIFLQPPLPHGLMRLESGSGHVHFGLLYARCVRVRPAKFTPPYPTIALCA